MAEIDFYIHVYGTKDAVNVKEISPTDVVERKKAFWEKHDDGIMIWWQCPICNHEAFYDEDYLGNFCPWCGADMRGDGDDNKQA